MSTTKLPGAPEKVNRRRARNPLAQIVIDKREQETHLQQERWTAIQAGTETTPATPAIIARMNEVQHLGEVDKRGNVGHIYEGWVGGERMYAQVTAYQKDVLVCFWARGDGRYRRLLITQDPHTGVPVTWIAIGLIAIRHTGKYAQAANSILALRAFETESHPHQSNGIAGNHLPHLPHLPLTGEEKGGH